MKVRTSVTVLALAAVLSGCAGDGGRKPEGGDAGKTETADSDRGASSRGVSDSEVGEERIGPGDRGAGEPALDLRRSVYYEFDRYEVKPQYRALVESHAAWLRANPRGRLLVTGNTDEHGTSEYNLALGQKRAESVTRMLVILGAKPEQVEAVSYGKEKPRAAGHDEASWAENRRSDFARP
jgi:peptidoglycan-associated lipoprotein